MSRHLNRTAGIGWSRREWLQMLAVAAAAPALTPIRTLRAQGQCGGGKGDIHDAAYKSYHTTTPNGFALQISNATKARRQVR